MLGQVVLCMRCGRPDCFPTRTWCRWIGGLARPGLATRMSGSPRPRNRVLPGSTGRCKIISITHRGPIHQAFASATTHGGSGVSLNWLPLDHVVPVLTYHLTDLIFGRAAIQVDTAVVLQDPLRWLDLIEQYGITDTWAPNFAFQLVLDALAAQPDRRWNLERVRRWMNAGELVMPDTMTGF